MKKTAILSVILMAMAASACKSQWNAPQPPKDEIGVLRTGGVQMLPKAVIYRTNGDWRDRVPISYDAATGQLVSFPAPSDIRGAQQPIPLTGGWLLDTRGVGLNSVFTRYTYKQYADLKQAPTPQQLIDSIIPDARVTVVQQLPWTLTEARADTARVNKYIREHLTVKIKK